MLFNSMQFLVFFPIVVLVYYLIPEKIKYLWLLGASYYFYMCWNAKYALLILFSTVVTYVSGVLMESVKQSSWEECRKIRYKKLTVALSFISNFAVLFYFKYTNFAFYTLAKAFSYINIELNVPVFDIVLPVGISFFTFQALSYTMDVYRNEIQAEKNIFRYALFVSFFPQLVAGPIERSKNLLEQLRKSVPFDAHRAECGLLTMAYGLFIKIVVADNLATVIDPVFSSPAEHTGMELFTALVLFAFQIYCDFDGYTKIAIGSAQVLGYRLNENFNTPYLAVSVKDFWRRWHISLTSWFRDYLYIPLGGSRKGKLRKQINTMIVFLCSGLWHGAAWHYVVWGGFNGLFSVLEDLFSPWRKKGLKLLKIDETALSYRIFRRIATFVLIDFTWLFFRADSLQSAFYIMDKIRTEFRWEWFLSAGYSEMFGSVGLVMTITISLILLFVTDVLKYKGKDIQQIIFNQQIVFRWLIYWALFMLIIYWGVYGTGYEQTQFIYFQF